MKNNYIITFFFTAFLLVHSGMKLQAQNQNFLSFDGNDYVKYTDDATLGLLHGATSYTLEAWIYPKSGGSLRKNDRIMQQVFSFAIVMWDGNNDGKVEDWYFRYYHNSTWYSVNTTGDATLKLNAWNHIAVVCNATNNTIKLYTNGVDVTDISNGVPAAVTLNTRTNDHLYIGEDGDGADYFYGYIDEIRLKDEAVNPSSLHSKITDSEYSTDSHTAALFHFDEGTGTTTVNTASGNNAILGGTAGADAIPAWRSWRYVRGHSLPLDNRYMWNGNSSSVWSTGTNWDPGVVPNTLDNVIIPGSLTNYPAADGNAASPSTCKDLSIESGGSLTIPVDKAITINGDLNIDASATPGNLTVESNSSGNGSIIIKGAASGSATVKRQIDAYTDNTNGWHEISSPVNNMPISGSDFVPGTASPHLDDLYLWDESSNKWFNYKNTAHNITNFTDGNGYLVAYQTSATKTFTGTLNTSDISFSNISLTTSKGDGWHLLGNPYSSALIWGDGNWSLTHVNGTAKVWDENKGNYTDIGNGEIIPSTNGFFIQVTSATNSLTIPAADRTHDAANNYKTNEKQKETLKIKVTNDANQYYDVCTLGFKAEATDSCDNAFDSHKLFSIVKAAPSLWTVSNGEDFSTNYLPEITSARDVPVDFKPGVSTVYHLTVQGANSFENISLILEDLKTGNKINLSNSDSYDFSANENDDVHRFVLHINGITDVHTVNKADGIQIFSYGNTVYLYGQKALAGKVSIFNTLGQKIYTGLLNGTNKQKILLNQKKGIYFVQLKGKNLFFTKEILIQ